MGTLISKLLENVQIGHRMKIASMYSIGLPPYKQREREEKLAAHVRNTLLSARRYHFSDAATRMASIYAFNVQNYKSELISIAIPQFDDMWLEWPLAAQMEAVGVTPDSDRVDTLVGVHIKKRSDGTYLITPYFEVSYDENVDILAATFKRDERVNFDEWNQGFHKKFTTDISLPCPISIIFDPVNELSQELFLKEKRSLEYIGYCLKREMAKDESHRIQLTIMDTTNHEKLVDGGSLDNDQVYDILRSTLAGGSTDDGVHWFGLAKSRDATLTLISELTKHAIYTITPVYGEDLYKYCMDGNTPAKTLDTICQINAESVFERAGMLRFVVGALALMNSKQYVTTDNIKPGQKRPGEKVAIKSSVKRPAPNYEFVELKVPNTVIVKEIQGPNHVHVDRMRHEVSGHFCYSHHDGDENCHHNFAKQSETRDICLLCGAKRWWRKSHERGNEELGYKSRSGRLVIDDKGATHVPNA